MKIQIKSTLYMLLAAIIWGSAFVAQRTGLDSIGPFYFCTFRSFTGSLALFIVYMVIRKTSSLKNAEGEMSEYEKKRERKTLIEGGLVCGTLIFFAMNMQQVGLVSVDAGKTGFITALYIVLVPVIDMFFKHRTSLFNWMGVALGVAGLYLLCVTSEFHIQKGDLIILTGAVFWAFHILSINHFAPRINAVKLTAAQFFVAGVISFIFAFFNEMISFHAVYGAGFSILYTGIMSTAIAFTLQVAGQKYANPTAASMVLSTEALWAVVFGFLILGERLSSREMAGCVIMLAAVVISQLPTPGKKGQKNEQDTENRKIEENL